MKAKLTGDVQIAPRVFVTVGWAFETVILFIGILWQDFAKSLLDVADNLGRASSTVKENFLKIDASKDTVGAVPLLKTLLQGVEMTDKQLAEV